MGDSLETCAGERKKSGFMLVMEAVVPFLWFF
jgi:hypothetical protein